MTAPRATTRPVHLARTLLPALVAGLLLACGLQWRPGIMAGADEWLRDHIVRARASATPEERLVIVDIDEASLKAQGAWPWPRERIATLVETLLGEYGARGVALDLLFPEPSPGARDGDQRLAMLAQYGPVVLSHAFDFNGDTSVRIGALGRGLAAPASGAVPAKGFIANHAGLQQARHIGNIGFLPDADGMIRRLPMQTAFDGRHFASLSRALLDCCQPGWKPDPSQGPTGGLTSGTGMRRVPYSYRWEAYTVVRAADILTHRWPAELVAGKLVLIGSSSLGLSDQVATPLSPVTSGMMVHAAALSAQLDAASGRAPAPWPGAALAIGFSVLVIGAAWYGFPRYSALTNAALLLTASCSWLAAAWTIAPHDAVFNTSGPLLVNLFLLAAAVPLAWQASQGRSRRLLGTLRQYVAGAVVDELLQRNLGDPLAPRRAEVTTLIADMEGYTTHVQALPVEAAAQLTRDFLDCLTEPVLAMGGTLDKYTGDGLVTFWGAPLPVADHADRALDAALAIVQRVASFNALRRARGEAPVRVRIGIESGDAMAGDFGSRSRSIYTAVGDSVNVASRLESAARDYPYHVIIGPGTSARTRRHRLHPLGEVQLRGREQRTHLYTLATLAEPVTSPAGAQGAVDGAAPPGEAPCA